jgi:hypothetical protein
MAFSVLRPRSVVARGSRAVRGSVEIRIDVAAENLTPGPFPSGKGSEIGSGSFSRGKRPILTFRFPFPLGKRLLQKIRFPFPLGKRLLQKIRFPFPLGKGLGVRLCAYRSLPIEAT